MLAKFSSNIAHTQSRFCCNIQVAPVANLRGRSACHGKCWIVFFRSLTFQCWPRCRQLGREKLTRKWNTSAGLCRKLRAHMHMWWGMHVLKYQCTLMQSYCCHSPHWVQALPKMIGICVCFWTCSLLGCLTVEPKLFSFFLRIVSSFSTGVGVTATVAATSVLGWTWVRGGDSTVDVRRTVDARRWALRIEARITASDKPERKGGEAWEGDSGGGGGIMSWSSLICTVREGDAALSWLEEDGLVCSCLSSSRLATRVSKAALRPDTFCLWWRRKFFNCLTVAWPRFCSRNKLATRSTSAIISSGPLDWRLSCESKRVYSHTCLHS